jgi:hypothetical protein
VTIRVAGSQPDFFADFSPEELILLNNCLNEVANGFRISSEHRNYLGASAERIISLLSKIHQAASSDSQKAIRLDNRDLAALAKAVRLATVELGTEFSIRTGSSVGEAEKLAIEIDPYVRPKPG